MKKLLFLALVFAVAAVKASGQTTVADFDSPACSGRGVGIYQGIDFSPSPWNCGTPGLAGQTGTSISLYRRISSGQFKFVTPGTILSLSAAASGGSGTLTISTDAGETFSHPINSTFQTLVTGFKKAASIVTVSYSGGRSIDLDNIMYQTGDIPSTPGVLTLTGNLTWDDGSPVVGGLNLSQITSLGATLQLGTFPIDSTGVASGTVTIDLTQPDPLTFRVVLLGANNAAVGAPATFQVLKIMFPSTLTGINAKVVLSKSTLMIKSFNMGLLP